MTKYLKKLSISTAGVMVAMALSFTGHAQTQIDPTLEVKRDFDAKLANIIKSKIPAKVADSIRSFNLGFEYSIFNKPFKDLYEFSPLPSAQIQKPVKTRNPFIYAKMGLSYPIAPSLEMYIQPNMPQNMRLLILAGHNSFLDDIKMSKENGNMTTRGTNSVYAMNMKNRLGAAYNLNWDTGELNFEFNYKRDLFTYYGFADDDLPAGLDYIKIKDAGFMRDSMSHQYDKLSAKFGIRSVNSKPNSFYYNFGVYVSMINDKPSLPQEWEYEKFKENYVKFSATFGPRFAKYHNLFIGFEYQGANTPGIEKINRESIDIYPHYKFEFKSFDFNLGAKFNYAHTPAKNSWSAFLVADATLEVIKNNLWFKASIDGENNFMTYHKIIEINPWVAPDILMMNTKSPLQISFSALGQSKDRLSYNVFVSYTMYKDAPYFYNSPFGLYNLMRVGYYKQNRFSAGGEVSWKSKDLQSGLRFTYNSYNQPDSPAPAYNKVPVEVSGFARYNWRERIVIGGDFLHRAKSPAMFRTQSGESFIGSFTKIDLNGTYVYDRNLSFYVQLNNILNAKEQYFLYYKQIGFNFGAGITLKF